MTTSMRQTTLKDLKNITNMQALPSYQQEPLKVHDIMSVEKVRVYENDDIESVLNVMFWEDLLHTCVFDERNNLVGILHFNDALSIQNKNTPIKQVMKKNFEIIYGGLSAEVGKKALIENDDHCLPVFENQKIIGILNIENVIEYSQYLDSNIEKIYA